MRPYVIMPANLVTITSRSTFCPGSRPDYPPPPQTVGVNEHVQLKGSLWTALFHNFILLYPLAAGYETGLAPGTVSFSGGGPVSLGLDGFGGGVRAPPNNFIERDKSKFENFAGIAVSPRGIVSFRLRKKGVGTVWVSDRRSVSRQPWSERYDLGTGSFRDV